MTSSANSREDEFTNRYTHFHLIYFCGSSLARRPEGCDPQSEQSSVPERRTIWEAVIKHAAGKLPVPPAIDFPLQRSAHGIEPLPMDEPVMLHLAGLPSLHKDPFDRLLIAQAIRSNMTLVTMDIAIRAYPIRVLPA